MAIDLGQNLSSNIGYAQNAITTAGRSVNTAKNLGAALSTAYDSGGVMKAIRSINLPTAGEAVADIASAVASFGGDADSNDWRVRLSLSNWISFKTSPVLAPLNQAGGLIFPYTPEISISNNASYSPVKTTHSNNSFNAYQNSSPGSITITAPMFVEDANQGLYWIAAVHYLRSLTKMFSGSDMKAGNPPPIIYLNGYGNYVFKNIPVVVSEFSTSLNSQCDYIGVNVVGSLASEISGLSDSLGGLVNTVGGAVSGLSGLSSQLSSITGTVGEAAGILGTLGIGGTASGGITHVPTKSEFRITLLPSYSRENIRKFSLDRFVTGGYLNSSPGFI